MDAEHRARASGGWSPDTTRSNAAAAVVAFAVHRYRHRHPGRQAADHLRGVPAGRRHHQPQVRRHRASASRSAARSPACSAARSGRAASRARAAPSRSTCRSPTTRRERGCRTRASPARRAGPARCRVAAQVRRRGRESTPSLRAARERAPTTATRSARRSRAADRRGRRAFAPHPARHGARQRLQGRRRRATGSGALPLARRFSPTPITLDIDLPDMDGWTVLDRLKHDSDTRHIPVHIISVDDQRERGLQHGRVRACSRSRSITRALQRGAVAASKGFVERARQGAAGRRGRRAAARRASSS